MTIVIVAITALTGLVLLVWASRHLDIRRENRAGFVLSDAYARDDVPLPRVSVIVAAKDEQDNIGRCLTTMREQDYPDFEIVVANDRSTDRTAEIVEAHVAEDPRVRLIHIGELPAGWYGKSHAMQKAIATAGGERNVPPGWICMIDADCRQTSARSLRAAVGYAVETGADLLSVLPNLEMRGFWENVVQPVCGGIMMIWFKPDKVNSPDHPQAYANGAFMLMKRSAYEAIGGHEAVRSEPSEDMAIAARIKGAGLKLRVVRNRGLYLVRMYTSLGAILNGWSRIFYGTFGTARRLGISLALLAVMGLLPYAAFAAGLGAALAGASPGQPLLVMGLTGLAAAMMQVSVIYRFYRLIGARAELAWTYPIGTAVACAAIVMAMGKLRKGAELVWRNTTYTRPGRPEE